MEFRGLIRVLLPNILGGLGYGQLLVNWCCDYSSKQGVTQAFDGAVIKGASAHESAELANRCGVRGR
jgi:hypothetical protein